jgi:2-polyprenyl-6-methoxyphenol hydroxylase-like FAD-dependent oxidoreductase
MSEDREGGTTVFDEELGVLIVGAGPTELTLAAQLHAQGASVRIVDCQLDRVHESRALAVQPRTLEVLRTLGISEQLVERGNDAVQLRLHFGGGLAADVVVDPLEACSRAATRLAGSFLTGSRSSRRSAAYRGRAGTSSRGRAP